MSSVLATEKLPFATLLQPAGSVAPTLAPRT